MATQTERYMMKLTPREKAALHTLAAREEKSIIDIILDALAAQHHEFPARPGTPYERTLQKLARARARKQTKTTVKP